VRRQPKFRCGSNKQEPSDDSQARAETVGRIPPQVLAELKQSIDQVKATGIAHRALTAGDQAPAFTLPNAQGSTVALTDLLQHGPVIISFYRGIWCPYCNLELRAYQRILSDIRDFIAISPQTPDNSLSTSEKNGLEFEVLSDRANRVANEFGIAYAIPDVVKRATAMFGADIAAINGSDDGCLPISATYVIDTQRQIVLANIDADFRVRLEPADALAALRQVGSLATRHARESSQLNRQH
jgi:peroxiredoxin